MARTKRHPAWTWKMSEFEGPENNWWRIHIEKRHHMPIERLVKVMNIKGKADGIQRNAPKRYRQTINREFRAKQNQAIRSAFAQSKDMDALIIEPRSRHNANWM